MAALHQAALVGNVDIMKLLLDGGAAVDIRDNKGETTAYDHFCSNIYSTCFRIITILRAKTLLLSMRSKRWKVGSFLNMEWSLNLLKRPVVV